MSDSDMDIDDDEVQVNVQHTIAGESRLLARPIEASNSQNDVKKHLDEQLKIINGNLQPNLSGNSGNNLFLEGEKGIILPSLRLPAPGQSYPLVNGPGQSKIINGYVQPNLSGSSGKKLMLEGEKDTVLSRYNKLSCREIVELLCFACLELFSTERFGSQVSCSGAKPSAGEWTRTKTSGISLQVFCSRAVYQREFLQVPSCEREYESH